MGKKIALFVLSGVLLMQMCGCFALLAGAAGGAGTAAWLSGKMTQQFNSPYDKTIAATEKAMNSLKLDITKRVKAVKVAQFKSNYTDGKEIWIDIRRVTENSTKVDVRVGAVNPDKDASEKILKAIEKNL